MTAILIRNSAAVVAAAVLFGVASVASAATAADAIRPVLPPPPPVIRPPAPKVGYAKDRQAFLTDDMRKAFPRLGENFEVVGPANPKLNAYSAALGLDKWVAPEAGDEENPLAGADRFFGEQGYQRLTEFDLSAQPGVEKIVVYVTVNPDGSVKQVMSAAHQEADGAWTMKVGQMAKIRIQDPFLLQGPTYGLPYVVYAR